MKVKIKQISLINGQEMHRKYPNTFEVPTFNDLKLLAPKDCVKIGTIGERFWVNVVSVTGTTITGTLANNPITIPLQYGDKIKFKKLNVLGIVRYIL